MVLMNPMKQFLPVVLAGLAALPVGLAGCQDQDSYFYSKDVRYGVRTDPLVVTNQPGNLGDEVYDPDRPGVLPLLRPQDVLLVGSPLAAKGMELFKQNLLRDPMLVPAADRQKLDEVLTALFGTPAEPKVGEIDEADRAVLGLEDATLREGSRLYRIHCVHCHGVPGDGRGPTARWINPHPRDFRQGLFKFMSVNQTSRPEAPPRRGDLYRTLREGIEATAMPSFLLLKPEDLEHLVSYVIHLSLRGKAEFITIATAFEYTYDPAKNTFTVTRAEGSDDLAEAVRENHKDNVKKWVISQDPKQVIQVPEYNFKFNKKDPKDPDGGEWQVWKNLGEAQRWHVRGAIAQALFNNEEPTLPEAKKILDLRDEKPSAVNCKQCHLDYGRQAKFRFDSWGTLVRPNNFLFGVFRGGRRPVDLYDRIQSGIGPSTMTPFGNTISSNSIWDLVEFVQALAYPAMRGKLGININY
jgi:mono/diheme cytochrome c family protein